MTFVKLYDALISQDFFTEEELELVTNINGNTIETLNDCIYSRYGVRSYLDLEGLEI